MKFEERVRATLQENRFPVNKKAIQFAGYNDFVGYPLELQVYLYPSTNFPKGLGIQCFSQEVRGTACHKLPAQVLNIWESFPFPAVFCIGGGYLNVGKPKLYIDWLKTKVDNESILGVFELPDLVKWLNQNHGSPIKVQIPSKQLQTALF
ncbi:UNVERIFIED_CONTAM: hypothetical protein BEN50_11400 [Euhalothece sp. KZN 001]